MMTDEIPVNKLLYKTFLVLSDWQDKGQTYIQRELTSK